MPKHITGWKCDYCSFVDIDDVNVVLEHEKKCLYNPEMQSCYTCRHETFMGLWRLRECAAPRPYYLWHLEKGIGCTNWPEVPVICGGWEKREGNVRWN